MKKKAIPFLAVAAAASAILVSRYSSRPSVYASPLGTPLALAGALMAAAGTTLRRNGRDPLWGVSYCGEKAAEDSTLVCFANVLYDNPYASELANEIAQEDPDIVILAETDLPHWDGLLQQHFPDHFYRYGTIPPAPGGGFRIVSRLPMTGMTQVKVDSAGRCFLLWKSPLSSGRWVTFVAVHPAAPVSKEWTSEWALYLNSIVDHLPDEGGLVIAGDFNATNQHGPFRNLLNRSRGELITEGVPTWPQNRYSFALSGRLVERIVAKLKWVLPLDQAIVREVPVVSVRTGLGTGSDHRPIYLEFS